MFWKSLTIGLLFWCVQASADEAGPAASRDFANSHFERILGNTAVPSGLGLNVHAARDLALVQRLGLSLIRTDLIWSETEKEAGRYNWGVSDNFVKESRARGITPLFILDYGNPLYVPPASERWDNRPSPAPVSDVAQAAFARFASAAVTRYRGVAIWEVWNEPNLNFGKPIDLGAYIRFAGVVCKAMRRADPDAAIIGPASAGFAISFLQDFIATDRDHCFDAVSVHPYRESSPETALRDWARLRSRNPGVMLVDSEWGYPSIGGEWSLERQADYVTRLYLIDLLAGIPITIIYDARNDGLDPADREANFGLSDFSAELKPAARQLAMLVRGLDSLELSGRARSPSGDFLLLFGAGDHTKLVAWTVGPAKRRLSLGSRLCIAAEGGRSIELWDPECKEGDVIMTIEPVSLTLTQQPVIVPIRELAP